MTVPKRIFACQPVYSGASNRLCARQFDVNLLRPDTQYQGKVFSMIHGGSLLANTFNEMWVAALNFQLYGTAKQREITHFAMVHDDVHPADGWLDIMLEALLEYDADVMSVVCPIKTLDGITSTAIEHATDRFTIERRLTMTEVFNLPDVFDARDCGYFDRKLLINTGCWICDFTKPWRLARNSDGKTLKLRFHIDNEIREVQTNEGLRWQAVVASEDWNFSREIMEVNPKAKVYATRRVPIGHYGTMPYCNTQVWGDYKTDKICPPDTIPIGNGRQLTPVAEAVDELFKRTKLAV